MKNVPVAGSYRPMLSLATEAVTAAAASSIPDPQYLVVAVTNAVLEVQSRGPPTTTTPLGNGREVDWILAITCPGVCSELTDSMRETTPETCGTAMLVPW